MREKKQQRSVLIQTQEFLLHLYKIHRLIFIFPVCGYEIAHLQDSWSLGRFHLNTSVTSLAHLDLDVKRRKICCRNM